MTNESTDGAKFCPRCGKELLALRTAEQICDCGWRSKSRKKQVLVAAAIVVICGVTIAAWIYLAKHYREYFPDKLGAHEYELRGKGAFENGDHVGGLLQLQKATALDPNNAELRAFLARAYGTDGQYREGAAAMAEAARLSPRSHLYEVELGNLYGLSGNKEASIEHLKKAIAIAPKELVPRENLAMAYVNSGDMENAGKSLKALAEESPQRMPFWSRWAEVLKKQDKTDDAIAVLDRGLQAIPDNAELRIQKADMLIKGGRRKEAIPLLNKAAELQPQFVETVAAMLDAASRGDKKRSYLIPLHATRGGNLYTDVLINSKVKAKLVVDSGCSTMLLSPAVGRRLAIDGSKLRVGGFKSVSGVGIATGMFLDSVSVGDAKATRVEAMFFDMHDPQCDGLLGMSFLRRYQFTLDPERRQLILTDR